MNKAIPLLSMLVSALLLTSCVSMPTPEQIQDADYGTYPENYKDTIKAYMEHVLKDPSGATYNFRGIVEQKWVGGGIRPVQYGFGTCAYINAKNSFGAYTGNQKFFFLIRNDQVVLMENLAFITEKACPGSW